MPSWPQLQESDMSEPKPKGPSARETAGEGAPPRTRKEGPASADERAEPQRGDERADGQLIQRKRDAHNPEGI
jgi:hypothetical protein